MIGHYKLEKRRPVLVPDLIEWATWMEAADRHVARTEFSAGVEVSTVFLGLDHRFSGNGPPLLFETIVFGLNMENDAMMWRYSSWDDAVTGHNATVRKVDDLLAQASAVKSPLEC